MKEAETKTFIGVRLDTKQVERIDALAKGSHGLKASRSEVIRLVIDRGLEVLEDKAVFELTTTRRNKRVPKDRSKQ